MYCIEWGIKICPLIVKIFLESLDVLQVMNSGICEEYSLHKIDIYRVIGLFIMIHLYPINNESSSKYFSACVSTCLITALEEGTFLCYIQIYVLKIRDS